MNQMLGTNLMTVLEKISDLSYQNIIPIGFKRFFILSEKYVPSKTVKYIILTILRSYIKLSWPKTTFSQNLVKKTYL